MFGDAPHSAIFKAGIAGSAPINNGPATFSPEPKPAQESEVDDGQWTSISVINFTYQWQLNGVDILGATAKAILVLVGMVGGALRCVVKATNAIGFTLSITASIVVSV